MAVSSFKNSSGRSATDDFVINMNNTSNNTAVLGSTKPAGIYSISIGVNKYDIYFINSSGNSVGYSSGKDIVSTGEFNTVVILGASSKEVVSFAYQGTYKTPTNASTAGQEVGAGPYITSTNPLNLFLVNDTTTVSGGNFASNVIVNFVNDTTNLSAKNIVRSSSSQLIVTRPDALVSNDTYRVVVENPGVASPSSTELNISSQLVTMIAPPPSGGVVSGWNGKTYHTFTSSGTFNLFEETSIDYLVVAGGGGGGRQWAGSDGGGGGAGGLLNGTVILEPGTYSINVGAGGRGGGVDANSSGGNSSLGGDLIATGGGRSASSQSFSSFSGGSGGGGGAGGGPSNGMPGQGFAGGAGGGSSFGGGGGGAGEPGNTDGGGFGGDGLQFSDYAIASGVNVDGGFFAGGGSSIQTNGSGGLGGAGRTQSGSLTSVANTGAGGAGGHVSTGNSYDPGMSGASGIVIIRY
jgi:hypothetical protein